uniref:Uncharacterized protein n=1 Tax=Arundo donax TaxID=35708 RepID=A0A0A8ZYM6_ARUDO
MPPTSGVLCHNKERER